MFSDWFGRKKRQRISKPRRLRFEQLERRELFAVVDTLRDDITGRDAPGERTLRWAINDANSDLDYDTITFDPSLQELPIQDQVVRLTSDLPQITRPLSIRGPVDAQGFLYITVDGGDQWDGIRINQASGSGGGSINTVIEGLVLRNFENNGIEVVALPSSYSLDVNQNQIDSHGNNGIIVTAGVAASARVTIARSTIVSNGERKPISGGGNGVRVVNTNANVQIQANTIGTNGGADRRNRDTGVYIENARATIGPQLVTNYVNVISGNMGHGIHIKNPTGAIAIDDNWIGTNQNQIIGNVQNGIQIENSAGFAHTITNNSIGGNSTQIMLINASGVQIGSDSGQRNWIGTSTVNGTPLPGNSGHGIILSEGTQNTLVKGNIIHFADNTAATKGYNGVMVFDSVEFPAKRSTGNRITENKFVGSGDLPIDLSKWGETTSSTPNDPADNDLGPNTLLNHPVLNSVTLHGVDSGAWTAQWTLVGADKLRGHTVEVELYKFNPSTNTYTYLATESKTVPADAGTEWTWFRSQTNSTEAVKRIGVDDQISAILIDRKLNGVGTDDTSEMSPKVLAKIVDFEATRFYGDGSNLAVDMKVNGAVKANFAVEIYKIVGGMPQWLAKQEISEIDPLVTTHKITLQPISSLDTTLEDFSLLVVVNADTKNHEIDRADNRRDFSGGVFRGANGGVHIQGTAARDVVEVSSGSLIITLNGVTQTITDSVPTVALRLGSGDDTVTLSAVTQRIQVWGGVGNDIYHLSSSATIDIYEALDGDRDALRLPGGSAAANLFVDGQQLLGAKSTGASELTLTGSTAVNAPPTVTKTGAGTLDIITAPATSREVTFNANAGVTQFKVDLGGKWWDLNVNAPVYLDVPAGTFNRFDVFTVSEGQTLTIVNGTTTINGYFLDQNPGVSKVLSGQVVHQSTTSGVPVTIAIGNATITGTAYGDVAFALSGSSLRKFGTGTFQLTGLTDRTVAIEFINKARPSFTQTSATPPQRTA